VNPPIAYFVCPDTDAPSGGVRVIYRHVGHLTAAGIGATVVHRARGFRPSWFRDEGVPITSTEEITPRPGIDLLVIPEIYGPDLAVIAPGVRKAVFNQNAYNTFNGYNPDPADLRTPYGHAEVAAAVVVSEDNRAYLRHAFPGLDVRRTVNCVDPALFRPEPKRRRLAFMPRKNAEQAVQVLKMLAFRGVLDDVEVVALDAMSEEQVAAELRSSLLFLSFGYPEGCPCPPKEALASGCVVVGYHGMGGRDYLTGEHAFPVDQGDIVAFARTVETLLLRPQAELEAFGARAAAFVHDRYSPQAERDSAVDVWGELLAGVPARRLAA